MSGSDQAGSSPRLPQRWLQAPAARAGGGEQQHSTQKPLCLAQPGGVSLLSPLPTDGRRHGEGHRDLRLSLGLLRPPLPRGPATGTSMSLPRTRRSAGETDSVGPGDVVDRAEGAPGPRAFLKPSQVARNLSPVTSLPTSELELTVSCVWGTPRGSPHSHYPPASPGWQCPLHHATRSLLRSQTTSVWPSGRPFIPHPAGAPS